MKHWLILATIATLFFFGAGVRPAVAQGGETYVVQPGDTLHAVAARYGLSLNELTEANGLSWNAWLYTGQQLIVPTQQLIPAGPWANQSRQFQETALIDTVQWGDTLYTIAQRHGISTSELTAANNLGWGAWLHEGQQLVIPVKQSIVLYDQPAATPAVPAPSAPLTTFEATAKNVYTPVHTEPVNHAEKWIDVNLTAQTVTAFEGQHPVFTTLASTGRWEYPTVVGTYEIYVKYNKARMRGGIGAEAYDLVDVPYVMYFYRGYGLHGTYWHNNFGTPMSHGCVNLSIPDSEWFFNWASVGTKVVSHY